MKNFEKYEKELLEIAKTNMDPCVSKKDNKPHKCADINCSDCLLNNYTHGCRNMLVQWLYEEEHKEPIKLSRLEYELLKYFSCEYKYICRDSDNNDSKLYIYVNKPTKNIKVWGTTGGCVSFDTFKNLFKFVKWEDKEPTSIQNVLGNCMVVEDE